MTRTDRPDAADPPGNAKGNPSEKREPMAGLLASSPSKAIAANEFDPREAFYPKTLLTAEDLRGGAPAAKSAAAAAGPTKSAYVPDPTAERSSPLRFVAIVAMLAVLGGAAYWYFMGNRGEPASASAPASTTPSPNGRAGMIAPAATSAPTTAPAAAAASGAPATAPGQHITHTKGGVPEPARATESPRARPAPAEPPPPAAPSPSPSPAAPAKSCPPQVAALGLCTP